MTLSECLQRAPAQHALRIAKNVGLDGRPVTAGLLAALEQRISDPEYMETVVSGLSDEELTALKMIALCGGGTGIIVEKCHQKLNELSRKWRRNGAKVVDTLVRAGIVYTGRENYRQTYFVPDDLRQPLLRVFLPPMIGRMTVDAPARVVEPDPYLPVRHVHLLLSYLGKNQVRVVQGGGIYRRTQRDIISSLGLPDDLPDESDAFQAAGPAHLSFLVNYCRTRGLFSETLQHTLEPSPRVEEWVARSASWKAWDLAAALFDEWVRPDPDIRTALAMLAYVPEELWVSVESLVAQMESLSLERSWHGFDTRLDKSLRMLAYAGLVCTGCSDSGEAIRLTGPGRVFVSLVAGEPTAAPDPDDVFPVGTLDRSFFVQGTFEILTPPNIDPSVLRNIEAIADLAKPDKVLIYRMNRKSVCRGFSSGLDLESVMRFLETHSKNEIPQNVRYSIEEWWKRYGRVEFVDALVLRCDTEELACEIKACKRMQPFIVGEMGPGNLVIDRSQGYMPKPGTRARGAINTPGSGPRPRSPG
ncbi:MAG: helicase-associated domain-containing protein [Firmicutes bacterium]|nr:helicase-associated domain-containing protein [Bacillota bacterium]